MPLRHKLKTRNPILGDTYAVIDDEGKLLGTYNYDGLQYTIRMKDNRKGFIMTPFRSKEQTENAIREYSEKGYHSTR